MPPFQLLGRSASDPLHTFLARSLPLHVPPYGKVSCVAGKQGYKTLLSSPWYLNIGEMASEDWAAYYQVDPVGFNGTREQHQLVMGGEVCPLLHVHKPADKEHTAQMLAWKRKARVG